MATPSSVVTASSRSPAHPSLDALVAEPWQALALDAAVAADLLVAVAPVVEALRLAATRPRTAPSPRPAPNGHARDRWLDVHDAAQRLGMDVRQVYRRCHGWDFVAREGRRLRFSERGLEAWMERQRLPR